MGEKGTSVITFFMIWLLSGISKSVFSSDSRKGAFLGVDNSDLVSSQSILLKTVHVQSELACSQKCLANDFCLYKLFDDVNKRCELYREISSEDARKKENIRKKVKDKNLCDTNNCGSRCECVSLLGTNEYACDCAIKGLPKISPDYVHASCSEALASNGNVSKTYLIQPSFQSGAVSLQCERGSDGKGYAVFHHDTEAQVTVTGYPDSCGGYKKQFTYQLDMQVIILAINNSINCMQMTSADCRGVTFVGENCSWLKGRGNKKLLFWGGGPQNGTGCNCGIHGNCANALRKCNCDINNNYDSNWYKDEGYVTLRGVLPLTGIAIGDTLTTNTEVVKYTVGPLRCVV